MKHLHTLLLAACASTPALAHDGHGLSGSHWHGSDAWGFALVLAIAVAAWLITRGK
jgi:hypothetical protein